MKIEQWLWLKLLPKLNECHCGGLIPRSGEEGRKVNCYSIYLKNDKNESVMLVDSIDRYRVIGRCLDANQSFTIFEGYPIDKAIQYKIEIWHFYGFYQYTYKSTFEYLLKSHTGFHKLYSKLDNLYSEGTQWIFNRKKLVAGERYDLLKFLVSKFSKQAFRNTDVMLHKYGHNVFRRPDYSEISREIASLIGFLVDTNELRVNNQGEYSVTGQGWKTVNDYEETDRRVSAANKIQWGLFVLSFMVALLTAGQAGLIKFPTLWDLRSEAEKKVSENNRPVTHIYNYHEATPSKSSESRQTNSNK